MRTGFYKQRSTRHAEYHRDTTGRHLYSHRHGWTGLLISRRSTPVHDPPPPEDTSRPVSLLSVVVTYAFILRTLYKTWFKKTRRWKRLHWRVNRAPAPCPVKLVPRPLRSPWRSGSSASSRTDRENSSAVWWKVNGVRGFSGPVGHVYDNDTPP